MHQVMPFFKHANAMCLHNLLQWRGTKFIDVTRGSFLSAYQDTGCDKPAWTRNHNDIVSRGRKVPVVIDSRNKIGKM
jgi:hypothetical protein